MIWQGLKRIHLHLDGLAFSATLWIPKNQSSLKVNWCFEGWPFSALQTRRLKKKSSKIKKKFEPFRFGFFYLKLKKSISNIVTQTSWRRHFQKNIISIFNYYQRKPFSFNFREKQWERIRKWHLLLNQFSPVSYDI